MAISKTMERFTSIDSARFNTTAYKSVSRYVLTSNFFNTNAYIRNMHNDNDYDKRSTNKSVRELKLSANKIKYRIMQRHAYNFLERPSGLFAALYQIIV